MPLETPVSILYNSDGFELAVSGGSTPPVSSSAFMVAEHSEVIKSEC